MKNEQLCYVIVVIIVIILTVWGYMDILKKRQRSESSDTQVITRQLRGFGLLMLSLLVLVLGLSLCYGGSKGGLSALGLGY